MKTNYKPAEKKLLKKIGDNIRNFRNQKGISQEKLALDCNMDRTYVSAVERGERNISILKLKKIADVLEVEIFNLIFKDK